MWSLVFFFPFSFECLPFCLFFDFFHLQAAKARACGNLGNAYSALGEYSEAIKYYQMSLAVAKESNNVPGQAQVRSIGEKRKR